MRKLIQFLVNNIFYIIFLLLEVICVLMVMNFNDFQKSVFFTSSNRAVGELYRITSSTTEFFGLREKNENLVLENTELQNRVFYLENKLDLAQNIINDTVNLNPDKTFHSISAKVINNSTSKLNNYITLNKGAKDGVRPDMGVISDKGVVGIVSNVSERFSLAISVLNPKIKISCKFKEGNYAGSIIWDGSDYRYVKMEDIADHVPVHIGDTIITTGFSSVFPENIPVGVVDKFEKHPEDTYYDISVRLFTNFRTLSYASIISFYQKEEQTQLEENVE